MLLLAAMTVALFFLSQLLCNACIVLIFAGSVDKRAESFYTDGLFQKLVLSGCSMTLSSVDCVLIGYNDRDFASVFAGAESTRKHSPVFSELRRNSTPFRGQQYPFMGLLNAARSEALGHSHDWHVCELPNLGISTLASFLHHRGLSVEWINFFNAERAKLDLLLEQKPLAVAITTTFYVNNDPIVELVQYVRERSPETKVVVGGPHIFNLCSDYDARTLEFLFKSIGADIFVFDSQGESTLAALLKALKGAEEAELASVPNLYYTTDGQNYEFTGRQVENNDLDTNVVDWSLFPSESYTPTVQMRTARSCAFSCAFCRYPTVGGALTLNSVDVLKKEFCKLAEAGVQNVVFIDDTFNVPLPRFKKICALLKEHNFRWFSYFRCSNADEKAFDLMAESGCAGVFLGIESGDQTILDNMNKYAKTSKYLHGIQSLKARGIVTYASFIVGFPGETRQTFENTLAFLEEAAPTYFNAGLYFHDTKVPIHQRAGEFKLRGGGFNWQHETMNWRQANELLDEMYLRVQNSLVLPTYMFDFWSIPYLLGKGLSLEELRQFAEKAQPLLRRGLRDEIPTKAEEQALLDVFRPSSS
jgi:p-methyltransferase